MNNPQCEMNILAKLVSDKDAEALSNIDPIKFGNGDLQKLFIIVRNHYIDKDQWIGFDYLKQVVVSLCKTADKAEFMSGMIDQLKTRDIGEVSFSDLLTELDNFYKFRLITSKADKLISAVQSKDINGALGEVRGMYEDVFVNTTHKLEDSDSVNLMGQKVKYVFRKVGIPELDERGPLIEGGLTILGAGSGKGKSNLALQFDIYHYLNYEGSVAYFSFELSREEIYARIISNLAEIDVGNIISDALKPEEVLRKREAELYFHYDITREEANKFTLASHLESDESFNEIATNTYTRRKNTFYIFDESCNFDELMIKMRLLRDTKNVRKFTVDYLTLIPRGFVDKNTPDWKVPILYSERLKLFAKEQGKKCYVVTPVQFNDKNEELKFSKSLENAVDLYMNFKQDEDDKTLGTVTVNFGKFRTYLTVPNKPLKSFKLLTEFQYSRFKSFSFGS